MASDVVFMPTDTVTDRELIVQTLAGNQRAFAALVDRYKAMLFTVAFRITGSREDAEELAQSAFVKAYRSLADYRHDAKFSTWLYTIVHNLSLSFVRKHKMVVADMDRPSVAFEVDRQKQQGAHGIIDHKSRQQVLQTAMQQLQEDDAIIISLFYQGEQSLDEIAQVMGIEPNNAKVKLHRARLRLKKVLEQSFSQEINALVYQ